VHDVKLADILDTLQDGLKEGAGSLLVNALVLDDVVEELSVGSELHDEVELLLGLNDFVELDNGRVPHNFQDVDLPLHSLNVRYIADLVFLQDFYGYLF